MKFLSVGPAAIFMAAGVDAFFRMECQGRVGLARIDPMISPGEPSLHLHSIHGSSGFNMNATYEDLRNGDCTSCRVLQDKSAYWHPSMYVQDTDTGEFELVEQVGGMLAYYQYHLPNLVAFPAGFRMVAGDTKQRSWKTWNLTQPDPPANEWDALGLKTQQSLRERSMGFNCLNYAGQAEPTLYRHFLPNQQFIQANCPNGIRTEMNFPSCWNGVDLDSEDHRSHVAYPDEINNGQCPEGFDKHLPNMLFEVVWNTKPLEGRNGRFVMSNGDAEGFGYHGDFMMGWDEGFLQQVIDTCTSDSGNILDCPLFEIVTEQKARECKMNVPQILASEDCQGPLKSLPGGVPITFGDGHEEYGGDAPQEPTFVPSLAPEPVVPSSSAVAPAPESSGGDLFAAAAVAPSSASSSEPAPPVITPGAKPPVLVENKSYYSTQTLTVGNVVSIIYWEEETVFVTECLDETTTVTVTAEATPVPAPAARLRRHVHGHARGLSHRHR
ncbi:hypothetical protein BN1708_008799 [Verticillium longisporum]|uniref:DUF1996 domain-containing protein n=1 Tax=Verticillium longisporum TaxID=100787 RepID=A0A0G4N833_VERLO|nr:hypothetical protein HYQ44_001019 [Verticillium longisporum]CRK42608.1 hypothetical protein BN1708_008799 [Verticillium longisporum]